MPERFGSNESTFDALRGQTLNLPVNGSAAGAGAADSTYLRLDATNDPVTGALDVKVDSADAMRVLTSGSAEVFVADTLANLIMGRLNEVWVQETKYLVVDAGGLGDYTTIQAALNYIMGLAGPQTWTVLIRDGTYAEILTLTGSVSANRTVSLVGLGKETILAPGLSAAQHVINSGTYTTINCINIKIQPTGSSTGAIAGLGSGVGIYFWDCRIEPLVSQKLESGGSGSAYFARCEIGLAGRTYSDMVSSSGIGSAVYCYYCRIYGGASNGTGLVTGANLTSGTFLYHCEVFNGGGAASYDLRNANGGVTVGRCLYNRTKTSGTITVLDGDIPALTTTDLPATTVTGTGTTDRVAKFTGASTIGDSNLIGAGAGTLTLSAANTHTATFPATGNDTVAMLSVANVFTTNQKINANSTTALLVEQTGVNNNSLVIDTTNGRVGFGLAPTHGKLQIPAGTTAADGFYFGTDTKLYRGGANILQTDTTFDVGPYSGGSGVRISSSGAVQIAGYGTSLQSDFLKLYSGGSLKANGVNTQWTLDRGLKITTNDVAIHPLDLVLTGDVAGTQTVLGLTQVRSSAGANLDGGAIALNGKSSTTAAQSMGALKWLWVDATHASRKAKLQLTAFDTAERTGLEIAADGVAGITRTLAASEGAYATTAIDLTLTSVHHFVTVTASKTITLPAAATCTGREYIIKAVANNVVIDANASETIDGSLTATLINGECYQIKSDGANWHVV